MSEKKHKNIELNKDSKIICPLKKGFYTISKHPFSMQIYEGDFQAAWGKPLEEIAAMYKEQGHLDLAKLKPISNNDYLRNLHYERQAKEWTDYAFQEMKSPFLREYASPDEIQGLIDSAVDETKEAILFLASSSAEMARVELGDKIRSIGQLRKEREANKILPELRAELAQK
ncbi:hypothetical protein ACFL0W_00890 [Nanoarchaeota archaeon]